MSPHFIGVLEWIISAVSGMLLNGDIFLEIFKFWDVPINRFEIIPRIHLCYSHVLNLSLMRFEIIFESIFDCTKKCLLVRLVHVCIYIRMVSVRLPSIWEVLLTMYFNSTKSTQWQFKMSNLTHLRSRYNHCLIWILKEALKQFLQECSNWKY